MTSSKGHHMEEGHEPLQDKSDGDDEEGAHGFAEHGQSSLGRRLGLGVSGILIVGCLLFIAKPANVLPPMVDVAETAVLAEINDKGPAMVLFPQIAKMDIPKMTGKEWQGSNSYFLDVALSTVPGKDMAGGLYKLDAGPKLDYTYTYEEFKLIIDGEFHLVDGTGQKLIAKKGDLVYFPRGTRVIFSTPHTALGYYMGQRISPESAVKIDAAVRADIASNPAMKLFPQIASPEAVSKLPLLPHAHGSHSYLGDIAFSKKSGKEMTAGFYHEMAGPPLQYTYTYEELKYIDSGEFHMTDGTGQQVVAKQGDLVYFPKGTQVHFTTPKFALGFFCGQRKGGGA